MGTTSLCAERSALPLEGCGSTLGSGPWLDSTFAHWHNHGWWWSAGHMVQTHHPLSHAPKLLRSLLQLLPSYLSDYSFLFASFLPALSETSHFISDP